jgi:hypothetical protein
MKRERRSGYVLLMVLAVSVLVITVLATLAKVSLRRGLQAADAEVSLQQRWGTQTLQNAVLRRAGAVFELREKQHQELVAAKRASPVPPPPTIRTALTLGGVTFDLLLGDEDAKVNLNALYHQSGLAKTEQAISAITGQAGTMAVRLTPACEPASLQRRKSTTATSRDTDDQPDSRDAFRSWGEVFDLQSLQQQFNSPAALPLLTSDLTCWGNGQLNFRRASDRAILAVTGAVVQPGGAARLLQRYRSSTAATPSVLLQTEVNRPRDRQRLSEMVSETSTNFSLWIHASAKGRRSLQQLVVMNRDDEGVTRFQKFAL